MRNSPREAVKKILNMFDIFCLAKQIPDRLRQLWESGWAWLIDHPMKLRGLPSRIQRFDRTPTWTQHFGQLVPHVCGGLYGQHNGFAANQGVATKTVLVNITYFCCKDNKLPSCLCAEHRTRNKETQQQLTQRKKHWNLVAYKGAWPTMQDQAIQVFTVLAK